MNCSRHPEKRTISSCKDCGAGFCIDCVRETDQTTYCFDCYRRRLSDITREVTAPVEKEEEAKGPKRRLKPAPRAKAAAPPSGRKEAVRERPRRAIPSFRERLGRIGSKAEKKQTAELVPETPGEDFLAQGPDEDFSALTTPKAAARKRTRRGRTAPAAVPPPQETAEDHAAEEEVATPSEDARILAETATTPEASEDSLLQDVVSTLLAAESGAVAGPAPADTAEAAMVSETAETLEAVDTAAARAVPQPAAPPLKEERGREGERLERWSFLAQPRSVEYTTLSSAWWRTAIFIALMLAGGAVLWAVPNAYLIPKDQEYGIHAFVIGIILGLAFWWKAGKKHSTKLAVQAALTTFFALFIGEFLHWFLIIVKNQAFRTIFFDLISFKFIWENGPTIMRNTVEAMFPLAFLWILLLPTLAAFIIGYGMPPIPEIFFQIGRALKGQSPRSEEAGHGMEG